VVVLPLFQAMATRFPDIEPLLATTQLNYAHWQKQAAAPQAPQQ
jgi:hypothetical protein